MSRKKRIRRHYERRIHPSRASYDILDWSSSFSQEARFVVLTDNVDLHGKSLLDFGCGLGDLLGYLRARHIDVDYTGVDISEKMLQQARLRQSDARFVCADLFAETKVPVFGPESFDVVFCSGAFNLNLGNNVQFLPGAVHRLLSLARKVLVFNLLHQRAGLADSTYACYEPADILQAIQPLDCQIQLLEDYLPNDFTVICRKQSACA